MKPMDRLAVAIWEADRHLFSLQEALLDWADDPSQDWMEFERDRAKVRLVDQILFRYTKLQDAVGERLIPATLAVLDEPFEDWPMRDRLNRLEKLGYVDVLNWLSWREIRNRLAHEYPENPGLRFAALLAAINAARALAELYNAWRNRLEARLGELPNPAISS